MLRDMIDVADDKNLSQGTIFNCAHCNSYPDNEILGLIITARCDIANKDKVKFYNYIPAIPFAFWKNKDLHVLLKKKTYKENLKKLTDLICTAGFSENNAITYGLDKIIDTIVSQEKMKEKQIYSLLTLKTKIDCLNGTGDYQETHKIFPEEIKKILFEIAENKNSDFFMLDRVAGYGTVIVNLREIYELDLRTARQIPDGIEIDGKESYLGLNKNLGNKFCSIVGQMKSPYIELLIQRFANNFTRIGVTNPNESLSTLIMGE